MGLTGATLVQGECLWPSSGALQPTIARTERDLHRRKIEKAATFTAGALTPIHGRYFSLGTEKNAFTTMVIGEHVKTEHVI
uniref:Uncharacterized protein n=1 Tax=Ixodes pacificus TaxID=29930 RepID=Q6B895_IXOPA|nr:hypothetical protein [Ixodes pacificus]